MRVNVYAEEITDKIEILTKEVEGITFYGVRLYLELPVCVPVITEGVHRGYNMHRGPFMHKEGDDDSSAITVWAASLDKLRGLFSLAEITISSKINYNQQIDLGEMPF